MNRDELLIEMGESGGDEAVWEVVQIGMVMGWLAGNLNTPLEHLNSVLGLKGLSTGKGGVLTASLYKEHSPIIMLEIKEAWRQVEGVGGRVQFHILEEGKPGG